MPSDVDDLPARILLDACCVINLYASGRMAEILAVFPFVFAVCDYVARVEALRYYSGPSGHVFDEIEAIDLTPLIEGGLLDIVALGSDPEKSTFVEIAAYLDEGEAMTGAIALHRGWMIATDDRKAIRIYREASSGIGLITTPELMWAWAVERNPGRETLADALQAIRMRARYEPDANQPLADWWKKCSVGEG